MLWVQTNIALCAKDSAEKRKTMKDFMYSYPTKVYFGDGAARKALQTELAASGTRAEMNNGAVITNEDTN